MESHGEKVKCPQTLWLDNGRADSSPQASTRASPWTSPSPATTTATTVATHHHHQVAKLPQPQAELSGVWVLLGTS